MLIQWFDSTNSIPFQFNSKVQPKSAHQYVNVMWTLELSCVCELLVDLKLYLWKICSYYEFARQRKFMRHWIKHNSHLKSWFKSWNKRHSADRTNWKGTPQTKNFSFSEAKDGIVSFINSQRAFRFHGGINRARDIFFFFSHNKAKKLKS